MARHIAAHCLRLGLHKPPVSRAELTAAYRRAALKHHPDRGGCATEFAALTDSYNTLLRYTTHSAAGAAEFHYTPASLRSHAHDARAGDLSTARGMATALLLPCAIGVVVGIRMLYAQTEDDQLRAGGTSRFNPVEGPVEQADAARSTPPPRKRPPDRPSTSSAPPKDN